MPWIAVLAAVAGLQVNAVPTTSSPAPPEITVYGRIERDAQGLVRRFGRPSSGERLARWRAPICFGVEGLSAEHNRWIDARMGDLAESIGARVDSDRCVPNIVVLISDKELELRQHIGRRAYRYLSVTSNPLDRDQLTLFTKDDGEPAHVFYSTATASAVTGISLSGGSSDTAAFDSGGPLGAPVVMGTASHLVPIVEPSLARAVLVLDAKRLVGKSLEQIAAYAALITLAQVRTNPPLRDPPSIAALFDATPPSDLTVWDKAYLRALYGEASQINLSMQQSQMADILSQIVRTGVPQKTH